LVANAFVWYLSGFSYLQDATKSHFGGNSLLLIVVINFASLVLSAFIISLVTNKFKSRPIFLRYWVLAGALLSLLFVVVNFADFASLLVLAIIIGVYFGMGMPICMGYFAKTTASQNRAKLGGIIILLMGLGYPLISIIGSYETILFAASLGVWQILGLISILSIKSVEEHLEQKERLSYRSIISNKTFLLYAAPWLMFSLINELTKELNTQYFNSGTFPTAFGQNFLLIETVLAGASAIICGFLADKKGRKRLALVGFVLLGVGYASLGLFNGNYFAAWFYVCVDGVAWGAFSMLFLITIWGDIAQEKSSEKYYFLGVLPYLFSRLAGGLSGAYISAHVQELTVFSFAAFFLFVAVLPLVYAPETLPDKILKNLDLNSYVNKALEKVKKSNVKT
jgi:MFS family permease